MKTDPSKISTSALAARARRHEVTIDLDPVIAGAMKKHCEELGVSFEHHAVLLLSLFVGQTEEQVRADYADFEDLDKCLAELLPVYRPLLSRAVTALRDQAKFISQFGDTTRVDHLNALANELEAASPGLREVGNCLADYASMELDEALEHPEGHTFRTSGILQSEDLKRLVGNVEVLIGKEVTRG